MARAGLLGPEQEVEANSGKVAAGGTSPEEREPGWGGGGGHHPLTMDPPNHSIYSDQVFSLLPFLLLTRGYVFLDF